MDNRICKNTEYGEHIILRCKNHLKKTWSTKNIISIGHRSIFYTNSWMEHPTMGSECDCSIGLLYHDHKDDKCPIEQST